jgi:hypothetical protein
MANSPKENHPRSHTKEGYRIIRVRKSLKSGQAERYKPRRTEEHEGRKEDLSGGFFVSFVSSW